MRDSCLTRSSKSTFCIFQAISALVRPRGFSNLIESLLFRSLISLCVFSAEQEREETKTHFQDQTTRHTPPLRLAHSFEEKGGGGRGGLGNLPKTIPAH